ncbi:MAG: hypothetical protein ABEH61_01085 [Haloarculaceae archaeon]
MSADGSDTESGSNTTDSADTSSDNETSTESSDSGPGSREVAYRPLATEFDDADLSYAESDEERAPNYVVTPTGLRVNRLFAVGVLTEVEQLNSDTLRGRIVDPTGAFVTYAGQYQPEAQASLDGTDTPSFVALTGKARTFEPDDADRIFTSVRPESVSEVTADTRDRWTVSAAESTLDRIAIFAEALAADHRGDELRAALVEAGVDESLAAGIPRAIDHYGTTTAYLEAMRQSAVDALEVVADERDEVRPVEVAPDEGGAATLGSLPEIDVDLSSGEAAETTPDADASPTTASTQATTASEPADEPSTTDSDVEEPDSTPASADSEETAGEPAAGEPAEATADAEAPTAGEMTESPAPDETDDETETVDAEEPDMYQLDEEEREELESEYGADFSSGNEVDPAGEADIDVPDADELAAEAEGEGEATATAEATSTEPETTESTTEPETTDSTAESSTTETAAANSATTESTDSTGTLGSFEDTVESDGSESTADESGESTVDGSGKSTTDDGGKSTADDSGESTADTATTEETGSEAAGGDDEGETREAADIDLEDAAVELMGDLDDGDGADREAVVSALVDDHGVESAAVEDAIDDALMSGRCYEPDDGTLKPI